MGHHGNWSPWQQATMAPGHRGNWSPWQPVTVATVRHGEGLPWQLGHHGTRSPGQNGETAVLPLYLQGML